jgi:hypothetical protein
MKRVDVQYDGEHYSIGGRELSEVQDEVARGLDSGRTTWLEVNYGEGKSRPAVLALSPGVTIALSAAHDD